MKGIVFTEFVEMMEQELGILETQELLGSLELTDGGSYTAVGDYPFKELGSILEALCRHTGRTATDLLYDFGIYFANSIRGNYSSFFEERETLFDFLASVHGYIHVEVMKLYPNAQPPSLTVKERSKDRMVLHYSSHRALGDFASGLLNGVADVYKTPVTINKQMLNDAGTEVMFEIHIQNGI
jgi:hypothetical protein